MTKRELEKYYKDLKKVTITLGELHKRLWAERLRVGKLLRIKEEGKKS